MKEFFSRIRYALGFRTTSEKFQGGIDYVNETIKNAHLSTKEELQPLADILWHECNHSFVGKGDTVFEAGMRLRLTEMGFPNPARALRALMESESKPSNSQQLQYEARHPIAQIVDDSFQQARERAGVPRNLVVEDFLQREEGFLQSLYSISRTGNSLGTTRTRTRLHVYQKAYQVHRPKTLEDFFNQRNTVK